jgi:hypothetical protein
MECAFCKQLIQNTEPAWMGVDGRFYCTEICADPPPLTLVSSQNSLRYRNRPEHRFATARPAHSARLAG